MQFSNQVIKTYTIKELSTRLGVKASKIYALRDSVRSRGNIWGTKISLEDLKGYINCYLKTNIQFSKSDVVNNTINKVVNLLYIKASDLYSRRRTKDLALARMLTIYLLVKQGYSTTKAGIVFQRTPSTAWQAVKSIQNLIDTDKSFAKRLEKIDL